MAKRIGIFGGSFNPPHIGHVAICEWLLAKNLVDEVWVVPCFIHPFGKELVPFKARYEMCLFAFEELGRKVHVSKIEKNLGGVSHTIKTIRYILRHYPQHRFSLVTGGDIQLQASEWVDFDKIKELVPIISIPRGPKSPIPNISATEIRGLIEDGKPYLELVPPEVAVYIVTHKLYR